MSIHSPRIDDSGNVFFSASGVGDLQYNVYRIAPGSQEPVLVIDGNNGPLVPPSSLAVAVNGAGALAFLATRGLGGNVGIYTGPDPVADKVIAVGDLLDGRVVVDLRLGERAINNNGVDGRGQIVFAARLDGDAGLQPAPCGSARRDAGKSCPPTRKTTRNQAIQVRACQDGVGAEPSATGILRSRSGTSTPSSQAIRDSSRSSRRRSRRTTRTSCTCGAGRNGCPLDR